jgi:N-acetylmuramoyl-L-alanine amidase
MFKVAYCAGHYLGTPGKRVPKKLDPAETREWVLNDRVARFFNERMLQYDGVETMRTDDSTGKKEIKIKDRTAAANQWGADLYLDMHHNAGIDLGDGGGVVAYSYPGSKKGLEYRDAIYYAVIEAGGLRGNRSKPLCEKAYDSLKLAKAPAVLIEYGFMDSRTDYPIISTEEYAKAVGYATADAIAAVAGLKEKPQEETLYRVQCGSFSNRENAEKLQRALKNDGFDAVIVEVVS